MEAKQKAFLLLLKPEAVHRSLVGRILSTIETNGLKIVGLKMGILDKDVAEDLYDSIKHEPFFRQFMDYLTSQPSVAIAIDSTFTDIKYLSEFCGRISHWGTVRGTFANNQLRNIIHCRETKERSIYEAELVFKEEIIKYKHALEDYV